MRAIGSPSAGAIAQLGLVEIDAPTPGRGELLVRVVAAAVNPADVKIHRGDFAGRVLHARTRPLVSGFDLSGVVEACGAGVDDVKAGDEVFGFLPYSSKTRQGTFAERVAIARGAVAHKPSTLSHATAAAVATSGSSALQALRDTGRLRTGGRALVIGAAGGMGSLAIGVAKALGAHVTAICSTDAVSFVGQLGADEVIDRKITDPKRVAGPFDVILDTSGVHSYAALRHNLTATGAFVTTLPSAAWLGGKVLAALSRKRCHMFIVAGKTADLAQLAAWIAGGMQVPIDSTYPVRELAKALEHSTRGGLRGRIVIDVEGGW